MNRRTLLAPAALALAGCAVGRPNLSRFVPAMLDRTPPPRDRAAVFQSLLARQPEPVLEARDAQWEASFDPPARAAIGPEGLTLECPPGGRVWAVPRLPLAPLLPVAPRQVEELLWVSTLAIAPGQRFFVMCELRFAGEPGAVLIQPTPFDIQLSQDRERPGGASSVSLSRLVAEGRPHSWRLRLDQERTELRIDSTPVWSLEGRHSLAAVSFGEVRPDPLHGGTLTLRDVIYVRRPALATERAWLE